MSALWFDATTLRQLAGRGPVGFSRVIAPVLAGAIEQLGEAARFCFHDRYAGRFRALSQAAVRALIARASASSERGHGGPPARTGALRAAGRSLERALRVAIRRGAAAVGRDGDAPSFARGDVLLVPGDPWSHGEFDTVAALARAPGVRVVPVCYDMIPVLFPHQMQSREAVARFERYARFMAGEAALTICISQSARADLAAFARGEGIAPGPAAVVRMGADLPAAAAQRPPALPEAAGDAGFVLSVSTVQVRKNYHLLYSLWRRMAERRAGGPPHLVIAGARGWLSGDLMALIRNDPAVKDRIHVVHGVDDRQLSWLYARCLFTVYPSLYEGWGLPIPEAFAHGKACIASDTSSIPEASQGLALHLDPLDFRAWYDAIQAWLDDPAALRAAERKVAEGYRHVTWAEAGAAIVALVRGVADDGSARAA